MTKRERHNYGILINRLCELGIKIREVDTLRRIEMTLHRWAEHECNGDIQRDEDTDKPYRVYEQSSSATRYPVADREKGALRRLKEFMDKYPDLIEYHQTDPRGCALYILKKTDVVDHPIDQIYNRGVAVCI